MKIKPNLTHVAVGLTLLAQVAISEAQPVTRIAGGLWYSLFLKSDGSLWAMGDNEYGQLGIGTFTPPIYGPPFGTNAPQLIFSSNVTAIAAGSYHSLFVKTDGSLWTVGANNIYTSGYGNPGAPAGQLGDGTYNDTNQPEMIVASNVTAVAAGGYHSLFLKSDGSLWAMGYNADGELGDGTYNNTNQPEMIVAGNVTAIAAGLYHSLFLKSDGSLWAMGANDLGQLGDGTYNTTNRPEMIVASNVTAIAAGQTYSLFLKGDGSLWAMGYNHQGAFGDGNFYNTTNQPEMIVAGHVTSIAAGGYHSLFIQDDGSLWATGGNEKGELGDGTYSDAYLPEEIVTGNVTAVAGGLYFSLFTKSDGSLWAMGDNLYGQLGDLTTNNDNDNYNTNMPEQIVAGHPGNNQISIQILGGGKVGLSYAGLAGTNYVLDRSFSLSPPTWIPLATNSAGTGGILIFTNAPVATTNNFWRIRSAP